MPVREAVPRRHRQALLAAHAASLLARRVPERDGGAKRLHGRLACCRHRHSFDNRVWSRPDPVYVASKIANTLFELKTCVSTNSLHTSLAPSASIAPSSGHQLSNRLSGMTAPVLHPLVLRLHRMEVSRWIWN